MRSFQTKCQKSEAVSDSAGLPEYVSILQRR